MDFFDKVKLLEKISNENIISSGLRGLEKESLRITSKGEIAQTQHPQEWGSPLTHPYITTDYSESLPELITPPKNNTKDVLRFLQDLHLFINEKNDADELLWCTSMPCAVFGDHDIPIARYGNSNAGLMRHIYRVGLDFRYGRKMQAIAGVHFNYSLPAKFWEPFSGLSKNTRHKNLREIKDDSYFSMIRNYLRLSWVIPLLFGSSPVVCKSFITGKTSRFKKMYKGTYFLPNGTSLRMSDIGYKNKNQSALKISYNNLRSYVQSLQTAIKTPYPEYEAIGLHVDGNPIQLSTNILQIENEYYSAVRPKRSTLDGKRPTKVLARDGVEYVEMRGLDVDTLNPIGISEDCLMFCEAFLIACLLEDSPLIDEEEYKAIDYNDQTIALRGREKGLHLFKGNKNHSISMHEWLSLIFEKLYAVSNILDKDSGSKKFHSAIERIQETARNHDLLPSAKLLQLLRDSGSEFHYFALEMSKKHTKTLNSLDLTNKMRKHLQDVSQTSRKEQYDLECAKQIPISEYIDNYLKG